MKMVTIPLESLLFLSFIIIMVFVFLIYILNESRKETLRVTLFNSDIINRYNLLVNKYNFLIESSDKKQNTTISIPKDLFKKIISLCHPDKHNNSKRSSEVTSELLKIYKQ